MTKKKKYEKDEITDEVSDMFGAGDDMGFSYDSKTKILTFTGSEAEISMLDDKFGASNLKKMGIILDIK